MLIIFFSSIALILAFAAGYCCQKSGFWDWVDPIYYPLAIFGVWLFFFEATNIRQIANVEGQQRELITELNQIEMGRPKLDFQLVGEDLKENGKILQHISKMGQKCSDFAVGFPNCSVAKDFSQITIPGERVLFGYDGPEDMVTVCEAANEIFSKLQESDALSTFLMRPLAEHYFSGLKKGFQPAEFEIVYNYINELRPKLETAQNEMMASLSLSEEDKALMVPRYKAQITYGILIMYTFEGCLRAPEEIRSNHYAVWNTSLTEKKNAAQQLDQELRELHIASNKTSTAAIVRVSYWPYIIILALSLKFAKSIAQLRTRKSRS